MKKERLDKLLVQRGFFPSGEKARRAVMAGMVSVDGGIESKPGRAFAAGARILVKGAARFVSRGGEKLEGALDRFGIAVAGKRCLDVGASTGGFTDCLLQRGARAVTAVDVGYGQADLRVRDDPRVTVLDRTNARYLTGPDLPYAPELVTVDVSFISLSKIVPALSGLIVPGGEVIALIKPQFEAGRDRVGKGGVVRDERVHTEVIWGVCAMCEEHGFTVHGVAESPLRGPAGNREFFVYAKKDR